MTSPPLGKKEDLRLEFKSREALKKPEIIGREAVAMLNAEGGTIWVGLRDEKDRAVAVEPIPNADQERRRLHDYLVDTIEPSPFGGEVEVELVQTEEGDLLSVHARKGDRRPYAHLKEGRFFQIRVGDRTRPMTREEIFQSPRGEHRAADWAEKAVKKIWEELEQIQKTSKDTFWLKLKPSSSLDLSLNRLLESNLLIDPTLTRNRRAGLNFAVVQAGRFPKRKGGYLEIGREGHSRWEIHRGGDIVFEAPLRSFHAGVEPGATNPLLPNALLEYPVSTIRLAGTMLNTPNLWEKDIPRDVSFVAHLAIFGLQGWSLRAGSPRNWRDFLHYGPEFFNDRDFILDKPLIFERHELIEEPDRCGYRIVERIYEAFGFGPEDIPEEFDRKTGRLVLPE